MSTENLKPKKVSKLMLHDLEELGHEGDFSILKENVTQMYHCSLAHPLLDNCKDRLELFTSFKLLFNFLSKMEAYNDDETITLNLLP